MIDLVIPVIGVSSGVAYAVGTRRLNLPGSGVRQAVGRMLEVVGLSVVFLAINLATTIGAIVVSWLLSGNVRSLYLASEKMWIVLSLVQALVFQAWWRGRRPDV